MFFISEYSYGSYLLVEFDAVCPQYAQIVPYSP